MNDQENYEQKSSINTNNLVGFYSAIMMVIITIITFGLAMTAIPDAGAFCPENCMEYPYLDQLSQYPQDYLWMYPAILMMLNYLVLMVSIHFYATEEKKIFSQISVYLAIITTIILIATYFIQFTVIPSSLKSGETEGIAILTQYNSHGVFIALEELGYLMMSLSFLAVSPVFFDKDRLKSAIKWIFIATFALTAISFILIAISYGVLRRDRFEVVAISINWLALIANGVLLSRLFRREVNNQ
jgi:hypothetical protein